MSSRARKRFLDGEFADATPNQLFPEEFIDRWRITDGVLPDMVRVVVAVDPSGASLTASSTTADVAPTADIKFGI
jgi:phage terminase large subunit-like protein